TVRQSHGIQKLILKTLLLVIPLGAKLGTLLCSHLEYTSGLLLHLADFFAFVDRKRERFFAVNVFASLHGLDRNFRVPMVRRADDHGVDVFAFEHFAIIFLNVGFAADSFTRTLGPVAIHIANRDHVA